MNEESTSSHAGSSQFTVPYYKGPDKYQEEVSFCAAGCPVCLHPSTQSMKCQKMCAPNLLAQVQLELTSVA